MDRVSRVQQPDASQAVVNRFTARAIDLRDRIPPTAAAARALPLSYVLNPSGQAWLLLAFPDGTEDEALRMFEADTGNQQAGDAGVHRVALAGPAYEGVAVLAHGLLGPVPASDSNCAMSFEDIYWEERGAELDPRNWSVGCFRNPDQILPIFLIHIDSALHSDLQGEVNRLKRKTSYLQSSLKIQSGFVNRAREALRSRQRRAKNMEENYVMGHKRVTLADIPQPESSLHVIDLNPETAHEIQRMEELNSSGTAKRTRGAGTPGEIGLESIMVKLPGFKRKRRNPDGASPGGIAWDNRVLLNAVLIYSLSNTSLKEAGRAGLSFLSKIALEVFVKPEPKKGYQSRRIDGETPMPVIKPISPASVRFGVAALELAKNDEFIEWVRYCDVLNVGYDSTSVGPVSVQCVHLRGLKRVVRWTDAAGTRKLGADARSMCLDLKGSGDKFSTVFLVTDKEGKPKLTSIAASDNIAVQMHQAGMWDAVTGHPALTVVSDGGVEGSGKGNREVARQNMAGENSVGHHTFLLQTAGDNGVKLLNASGLLVPLLEAYGFDPLRGDYSTRKPEAERVDTIQRMLSEAMRAHREKSGTAAASSDDDDDDAGETFYVSEEDEVPLEDGSDTRPRPIYDPLSGPPAPGDPEVQPMPFYDFLLWDIGSAYRELHLSATMSGVTEAMLAGLEEFLNMLRNEALARPVDPAKCKAISIAGFQSLRKGCLVADDAINLVLGELTHVLGGRFVSKGGMYTTGPVSPLIQSNRQTPADQSEGSTEACYVFDSINAARLTDCVERAEKIAARKDRTGNRKAAKELANMVDVLRSRRSHSRQQMDEKKIVLGPGSQLFACTHLPLPAEHFVSTEVENLGASTEGGEGGGSSRNAVRIIRADSNSRNPQFSGRMHTALHITLRALGAIGTTQQVDHFGLPLPPQDRPDCAFYVLGRLVSRLTGDFPPPAQWGFITRLLRIWTDFQAYRQLLHDGAIQDVLGITLDKFLGGQRRQRQCVIIPDTVTDPLAFDALTNPVVMPALQIQPGMHALEEFWERAIAAQPGAEERWHRSKREELRQKLLDEVLKEASRQAEQKYVPQARPMPKRLCTTGPVMASDIPPLGAGDDWTIKYSGLVQSAHTRVSMDKNPLCHFLMAERDKRGETGGAEQSGASEPSGKQDETNGAGGCGASGANGGQRSHGWRSITNAYLIWCIRHRGHLAAEETFKRTDRFPHRAERAVNHARGPFVWPRATEHMRAF